MLMWDANTESDLAGYRVYRSDIEGGPYEKLGEVAAPKTDYTDVFSVPDGEVRTYYYVVTAFDTSALESDYSNEVFREFDGNVPPGIPQGLNVVVNVSVSIGGN